MFQFLTAKRSAAAAVATLAAGFAAVLVPATPIATARPHIDNSVALAKADRLPMLVTGSACSTQSWPAYDRTCQFDLRRSTDDVRTVRIVSMVRHKSQAAN